jgi:hypothetical protein
MDGKNPRKICKIMETDISVYSQESQLQCHIILDNSSSAMSAALGCSSYTAPRTLAPVDAAGNRTRAQRREDDLPGLGAAETHQKMPTFWKNTNAIFRAEVKFEVLAVVRMQIMSFYVSAPCRCKPTFFRNITDSIFRIQQFFFAKAMTPTSESTPRQTPDNTIINLITVKTSNLTQM